MERAAKYSIYLIVIFIIAWLILLIIISRPQPPPPKLMVAIVCEKKSQSGAYDCVLASAENGVDFSKVTVRIIRNDGEIIAYWTAPMTYVNNTAITNKSSDPISKGWIIDSNNDKLFSVNDTIHLEPIVGKTLVGLYVKVSGGNASGDTIIQ